MDTCRLPRCTEPLIDWLDREYCSVNHRDQARPRPRIRIHFVVDYGRIQRAVNQILAALGGKQ